MVVDANPDAIPFYRRLGIVPLAIVAGEIGDRPQPSPAFLPLGQVPAALTLTGPCLAVSRSVRVRFDGGTIVVDGEGAADLARDLEVLRWDPRIGAHRAAGYHWSVIRSELVRRGGQAPDGVRQAGRLGGGWRDVDLRPYQAAALAAWRAAGDRGLVVLPTGSGKTRVALAAIAALGRPALCLVPTRVLLDQWVAELGARWRGRVGQLGDGVQELEAVTVATFESAYRHMSRIGHRFELLVIDEAHHFGAGLRDEALEMAPAEARLGLTATPPTGAALARLRELVGPVVFERVVGDLAGRFLAPFEVVTLRVALTLDERAAYDRSMLEFLAVRREFARLAPGAPWAAFAASAARTPEGRRAMQGWREARRLTGYTVGKRQVLAELLARHRAARTLVFTADNAAAYAIAREHLLMPITCEIDRAEREEVLARFRAGTLRALVSAQVLNEGIDVPDADVAILVSGALGDREHVQRIGRVLRPAAGKRALVYELVAEGTAEVARSRGRRSLLAAREPADRAP